MGRYRDGLYFPSEEEIKDGLFSLYDHDNGVAAWQDEAGMHHYSYPSEIEWSNTLAKGNIAMSNVDGDDIYTTYIVLDVDGHRALIDKSTRLYHPESYVKAPVDAGEVTTFSCHTESMSLGFNMPETAVEANVVSGFPFNKVVLDTESGRFFFPCGRDGRDVNIFDVATHRQVEMIDAGSNDYAMIWSDSGRIIDPLIAMVDNDTVHYAVNQTLDMAMAAWPSSPFPAVAACGVLAAFGLRYGMVMLPAYLNAKRFEDEGNGVVHKTMPQKMKAVLQAISTKTHNK